MEAEPNQELIIEFGELTEIRLEDTLKIEDWRKPQIVTREFGVNTDIRHPHIEKGR